MNRIRDERGYLSDGYISEIEKMIFDLKGKIGDDEYGNYIKIAVIHHHFEPFYDEEKSINTNGRKLRELLKIYDFNDILHGHVHKVNHPSEHPELVPVIPCPSISGKCSEQGNGINILKYNHKEGLTSAKVYNFDAGLFRDSNPFDLMKFYKN